MASTSSSVSNSQGPRQKYDVFLSFRGDDTRNTFTSHLYRGLENRAIQTFKDDEELKYGDQISEELLTAIEESQVALVVFSENYATSSWCLDELVRIMECNKKKKGQTVMPVFYNVDPSHVRHQWESFAEAFAKHESNYKDVEGMQKVQGWREALREAASHTGCDTRNRNESECIRDLVDQISSKLCKADLSYLKDIVGINTHLEKLKSVLQMEINDVRIVGIWGIGGIGKTTIARAIFDALSSQFDGACFLADIKENEMHSLQNILLSELLREEKKYVNDKMNGKHLIPRKLRVMKVLVVLDDINHEDHLEYLAGDLGWFGSGSRIIATTRDKHLIGKNDIYEVTTLLEDDAIWLFNQYAFKEEARDECFKEITREVVSHAKGLPLALKVWGSFLHNRDIIEWRSAVDKIKKNSSSKFFEILKISYDGLDDEEQKIFLDIACFLRGRKTAEIMQILESCDFRADIGLRVLIDKSLMFIDSKYDTIQMHDLIQDMGKHIVKIQKDPGERSRLWDVEEIKEVMINNTGTKAVEAIWANRALDDFFGGICFSKEAMKNMKMLRILHIQTYNGSTCDDVVIEYLSNNLCWFRWDSYPWESLPPKFEPAKLVQLDLRHGKLCQLWKEKKHFPFLRKLDLSWSRSLMRTPDFRKMPNLEYLNLSHCWSLEEVDESLGYCDKLIQLDLRRCSNLKRFPCVNLESLEYLCLWDCSSLEKFPDIKGRSKLGLEVEMSASKVRELPSSFFQYQTHLTRLDLSNMENLVSLPSSVDMLKSLVELKVDGCSKLESLPKEIGGLKSLVKLMVYGCWKLKSLPEEIGSLESLVDLNVLDCSELESLPKEIGDLKNLEWLRVSGCSKLKSLPEEIGGLENLERLDAYSTRISRPPSSIFRLNKLKFLNFEKREYQVGFFGRVNLMFPQVNEGLHSLERLHLSGCNMKDGGLPEDIGSLSSLKELRLSRNNFENLPRSIAQLGALRILDVSHCPNLKEFPQVNDGLRSLEELDLSYCNLIDGGLPEDIGSLSSLKELRLSRNNFENLPRSIAQLAALRSLDLSDCKRLKELPSFMGMANLEYLNLGNCDDLEEVPCVNVESLKFLNLRDCSSLEKFPEIRGIMKLELEIKMEDSGIRELPSSYFQSKANFTMINFSFMKHLVALPSSIGMLKSLNVLDVSYCSSLKILPEEIGDLENLEKLDASCTLISRPPSSIVHLNKLKSLSFKKKESEVGLQDGVCFVFPSVNDGLCSLERLYLSYCNLKDGGLPEDIGSLSSLKELYLNGNNFENLPRSIAKLAALQSLDLSDCKRLKELPGFMEMPNLEYLNLGNCDYLEEVDDSLGYLRKTHSVTFGLLHKP